MVVTFSEGYLISSIGENSFLKRPETSAKRILPALREAGVLKTFVEASGQRSALLGFPTLFNIAESREVF